MVFKLVARIARALDKAGIPYMLIGGLAAIQHGRTRVTEDVDLALGVG